MRARIPRLVATIVAGARPPSANGSDDDDDDRDADDDDHNRGLTTG
jgi:hypothetical protein